MQNKLINKTLNVVLAFSVAASTVSQTSFAEPSNTSTQNDERVGYLIVPPMVDAVQCFGDSRGCKEILVPANQGDVEIRARPSTYRQMRTSTRAEDGSEVVVNSYSRSGPASFQEIYGKPYMPGMDLEGDELGASEPFVSEVSIHSNGVTGLEIDGGFNQFLRESSGAVAGGIVGAAKYSEMQREMHNRQASAARELANAYREGRAINGRYVRAVEGALSQAAANAKAASTSFWIGIGAEVLNVGHSVNLESAVESQRVAAMAESAYVGRIYSLNSKAVNHIANDVRKRLAAGQYRAALSDLESLVYNRSSVPIPEDLNRLINDEGVFLFERYDSAIPDSPLSHADFRTKRKNEYGQIVRRTANLYQAIWAESKGLQNNSEEKQLQFLAGLAFLRSADSGLADSQLSGFVDLVMSNVFVQIHLGLIEGAATAVKDTLMLAPELLGLANDLIKSITENPSKVIEKTVKLIPSLPEVRDALTAALMRSIEAIQSGSPRERAEIVGRLAGEVLITFVSGGIKSAATTVIRGTTLTAKFAKSAGALRTATKAALEYPVVKSASLAATTPILKSLSEMPPGLRTKLLKNSVTNPLQSYDALGIYQRMIEAGTKLGDQILISEAARVAEVSLNHKNRNARQFLKSVVASKKVPEQAAKYFKNAKDAVRILQKYDEMALRMTAVKGKPVEGYVARFVSKEYVPPNNPEAVFNKHIGSRLSSGRIGIGGEEGLFVQSSGFGTTPAMAKGAAAVEIKSYDGNLEDMVGATKEVRLENALDLTDRSVREKLQVALGDLKIVRRKSEAYEVTNIIGHVASKRKFDGVLMSSAPGEKGEKILHLIK